MRLIKSSFPPAAYFRFLLLHCGPTIYKEIISDESALDSR